MRRMRVDAVQPRAQRARYGRPGVEEIDVDAARSVVSGRMHLFEVAVLARPADFPCVHFADAQRGVLAQQPRQRRIAQAAAGRQGIGQMVLPVIGALFAQRNGDGHLRHHRGSAAADQAAVDQVHAAAVARRGDGGIHAGAARADYQHIAFKTDHCAALYADPRCATMPSRQHGTRHFIRTNSCALA